jgi:CubicO group peptidase (beta-lactamase class C family)
MHRRSIVLALLLASTSVGAQAPPGDVPEHAKAIDFTAAREIIRAGMTKDAVPGVAIAVAHGDSILWEEGFGLANRERNVPATAHTPFYLASITKTITATAAMLLAERKRLELDRPANDYLRGSRLVSPAWDAGGSTVRRLATHMSGLATFDLACAPKHPDCPMPSPDEIIRRYGTVVWPPEEQFDYSNLGYLVLGEIVAQSAGRDLSTVLRDEIFFPLGMHESSLGVDPKRADVSAVRYSWTAGALPHVTSMSGSSTGYSSVHDLELFGMLHAKVRRQGSRAILSDAAIDSMQYSTVATGGDSRYSVCSRRSGSSSPCSRTRGSGSRAKRWTPRSPHCSHATPRAPGPGACSRTWRPSRPSRARPRASTRRSSARGVGSSAPRDASSRSPSAWRTPASPASQSAPCRGCRSGARERRARRFGSTSRVISTCPTARMAGGSVSRYDCATGRSTAR